VADSLRKATQQHWLSALLFGRRAPRKFVSDACLSAEFSARVTELTDGFSGREISKMYLAVRIAMEYAPIGSSSVSRSEEQREGEGEQEEEGALTSSMLWSIVQAKRRDHLVKR
jgi:hypothetical protein